MSSLEYCTLQEAKQQLRIPSTDEFDDEYLIICIQAASAAVKNYLNDFSAYEGERDSDDDYVVDSNFEPVILSPRTVKPEVRMATLMMVERLYDMRASGDPADDRLPGFVRALLSPLRTPVLK